MEGARSGMIRRILLRFACRHLKGMRGMWRLNLRDRAQSYRFCEDTLVCRAPGGEMIKVHANDTAGKELYFFGEHQPEVVWCMGQHLSEGDIAMDIGAHVGLLTIPMAKSVGAQGKVIAVEAAGQAYRMLLDNLRSCEIAERVLALNCAVGEREGAVFLAGAASDDWGGRRVTDLSDGSEPVKMRTLDSIWAEAGRPHITLVKMDIEGSEPSALKGATRLMERDRPDSFLVEFNIEHLGGEAAAEQLWAFFMSSGYLPFGMDMRPLAEFPAKFCDILFRRPGVK